MSRPPDPAQVANDLEAQARRFRGTGHDDLVRSLVRGAATIRHLLAPQAPDREGEA